MKVSTVSLQNPESCWKDEAAKSIGYFSCRAIVRLDAAIIGEIREMARASGQNVRLSLHEGPESDFHEMIIFQHRNLYYRPKKHVTKPKSFHIIEGTMAVFVFHDDGKVLDACVLDGKEAFVYRVGAGIFHTDVPLTDYVIHHESTLGPFQGDQDRVFAPWSPDGSDREEYMAYRDGLVTLLGRE